MNSADHLTMGEAAGRLGIRLQVMKNYLYEGKLTTVKFKHATFVLASEVAAWRA